MIVALLATLGATVVAFVLYPVFAETRARDLADLGETEREILDLEEKKGRLYEALTDLDFEKEAGKVSEADYQSARNDYLAQVAAVLARVDVLAPRKGEKKPGSKARKPVEGAADVAPRDLVCQGCGEILPKKARFCMACGKKVGS